MSTDTLRAILAGLDALRTDGLVEPMALSVTPTAWSWLKCRPLEGHPSPGNAGGGWSHPKKHEVLSVARGRFGHGVGVKMTEENWDPSTETRFNKQILHDIVMPIVARWDMRTTEENQQDALVEIGRDIEGHLREISISRLGRQLQKKYPNIMTYQVATGEAGELQFIGVLTE